MILLERLLVFGALLRHHSFSEAVLDKIDARAIDLRRRFRAVFASYSKFKSMKFSALEHISDFIRSHGAPTYWSMEAAERMHQQAAKAPYDATNRRGNVLEQMATQYQRELFLRHSLPALLEAAPRSHPSLTPSADDESFLRGRLREPDVSSQLMAQIHSDWAKIPGRPVDTLACAVWFAAMRLVRHRASMDTVVRPGDCVQTLTLAAGAVTVPNAGSSADMAIARVEAFFYCPPTAAAADAEGAAGDADAVSADDGSDGSDLDCDHVSDDGGGAPGPAPAAARGRAALEGGRCFAVLRYYHPGTPAAAAEVPLEVAAVRTPRPTIMIECINVIFRKVRVLPHFHGTAARPLTTKGVLVAVADLFL